MSVTVPADHNLQKRMRASLLGVVGSFVLFAAYLAIPPIGIFSGMLAPFPAAYNRVVHGRLPAIIVLLGTTAAITAFFGIFAGGLYIGMCGMISFLMPELLMRGICTSKALFWTTASNLLVCLIGVAIYSSTSGIDFQLLVSEEISSGLKQTVLLYEKAGVSGEELEILKRSMITGAELLARLYPALVTIMLLVFAGCNLAILKKSVGRVNTVITFGDFSFFRNPDMLVWVLIITGFSQLLPRSVISTPALNILLIVAALYFIQGMAIVTTMVAKSAAPSILRVLLYAILIIQPYLLAMIAGIGLFDLWVDFRTPKTQENL